MQYRRERKWKALRRSIMLAALTAAGAGLGFLATVDIPVSRHPVEQALDASAFLK